MPKVRIKRLRGSWGELRDGQINLDSNLKDQAVPSKALIKFHEEFHKFVDKKKLVLSPAQEEHKAWIYGLIKCKDKDLSYLEGYLKKCIIRRHGRSLTRKRILEITDFL